MATLQDVLNLARVPLNDPVDPDTGDGVRYLNAELLQHAAAGIQRAVVLRPDLRFGKYKTDLPATYAASDSFPLTIRHLQTVADYVVFRAESKDDEHVNTQRAVTFLQNFDKDLLT